MDRLKQTDDEENEIAKVHFFNEFYQILKCFLTLDGSLVEAFHAIMLNAIKDFNTSPPLKFTILQLLGIYFQTAEESTDTVISIRDKLFTDLIEKFISSIEESSYIEVSGFLNCNLIEIHHYISFFIKQTEFMKLISTLARKKMFPGDVGKTYPPLFQKIFSRLKDMECNYDVTLCKDEILLYISALCTLVEFSNQYPKLFYAQMEETFKLNMIPVVLSKAQMLGDHATCYAILKLAKLPEFPTRKVAKVYCEQNFNQPKSRQTSNFIEFLENNKVKMLINKFV